MRIEHEYAMQEIASKTFNSIIESYSRGIALKLGALKARGRRVESRAGSGLKRVLKRCRG